MQLTVKDWMTDLIVMIDADRPVTEALALMRRRYVNSLIVQKTAANPHYGIITTTDICDKIVARNQNPAEIKVADIMNSPVISIPSKMSIMECAGLMKEHRFHHLPVADEKGTLIGMISSTDFLVIAEALAHNFAERMLE